jgi:hypothetical protein
MTDRTDAKPPHVLSLTRDTFVAIWRSRHSFIMASAIVLIMLWGTHGGLDILGRVPNLGWAGPGSDPHHRARLIAAIPWDQEWISFGLGAVLLVLVPAALVRARFGERLRDYGLGLPRAGWGGFTAASALALAVAGFTSIFFAARDPDMRRVYPLYRDFGSLHEFAVYELGYFVFFLVIEFTFRGYLLFGLYGASLPGGARQAREGTDPPLLSHYSIVVSMLSYTAWHLGKPLPEQLGTLLWGVVAGAIALASGTIWHIVLVHWSMNVLLDYLIWTS